MKHSLLFCAVGALAVAGSGCAYQQGSSYGSHTAYPTYQSHSTSYAPYRRHQQHIGATRLEFEASREQFIDGDIIEGGNVIGGVTTNDVAYKDVYKAGYRLSAGLARDVRPNTTFSAKGFYKEAEADGPVLVGNNGGAVNATFSDFKSYGAELGLRQYMAPQIQGRMRPYLGGTLGAAYIDDIAVTGGLTGPLNEAGWVATASGTAGLEMPISPTGSLALESGVRWTGSQDRTAVASAAGFTDDGSKLSVPITLRGSFRF
ncbi:hypothetical protein GCM10007853_17150 [Algimonas ampicilliniresistens]|jgi:hypothetical protein|uniref:Autotransporter outer membrane beta-barrel domain-containing protein n=1 Tax=Algimonas ampicilliniresistens TaxID=1298735 RepID=A0ABQ5VB74_9PROT|nr:hypothetical protein [Algimonas ampicilliniresistens]GLQ23841.1 hypothetical protein GCM10007853_17150 [Algimonas ampicilliniresistens]